MRRHMPFLRFGLLLGGLVALLTACQWPAPATPAATLAPQNAVATMVAGTLTAQPPPPTATPAVAPTATPAGTSLPGSAQFLWAYRQDTGTLTLYSATGEALWSLPAPNLETGIAMHTASPVNPAQPANLWLIYAAFQQENKETLVTLVSYHNGQTQTELKIGSTLHTNLIGLAGMPAAPRIAYSTLTMVGYDYHSVLYVHSLGTAPPTHSLYEITTSDGRIIRPLSLGPDGVWFTYDYYGAPMGPVGLYHITYTGEVTQALPDAYTLLGFDAATGWVAYRANAGDSGTGAITWRLLEIGDLTAPSPQTVTLADPVALPEAMPTGAAFSEGYIAWSTHVGPFMDGDDYLRVYTLDGQAVSVEPPTASPAIFPQTPAVYPVTWLNQQVLVLRGHDVNANQDILILTPPDLNEDASVTLPGIYLGRAWTNTP
ncbi:MAG TPA: hypothetical protein EYH28_09415 [Anaerolineaceae bacterium]|nr:hypothetical protein [Anaerolineales bacterium]HIQ09703.1 hypothetical protein [Anaerolineaceae bacterium]